MSLKDIGFPIDEFPVQLTRTRVIEYFDGDRIVEYRSGSKDPYFKIWSDTDRDLTRWFVLRLTDNDVARFLHGDLSLRALLLGARDGHVYAVDERGSSTIRVAFLRVHDIPSRDLPAADSFYDNTLTPECDTGEPSEQLILLDGEWNAEELAQFERRYTQVYAFNALFALGTDKDIGGIENRFRNYIFAGSGWSHVSVLDKIVATVPRDDKPRFQSIQLSSPGVVRYGVDGPSAERVREVLSAFRDSFEELNRRYHILDNLRMETNREAREIESRKSQEEMLRFLVQPNDALRDAAISLSKRMGIDAERIWYVAGTDVNSAELIANYYRRSLELYNAEAAGHAVVV